ncbi:MAG: urease accessory protein UreD [Pseudomonadota bacterium]
MSASAAYALDLSVEHGRLVRHRVAFPWSLGRPYSDERWSEAIRIIPQVAGAGLLSGDHVRQRLRLGAHARMRLESAGAMQVLSGDRGVARSDWQFEIGPHAMLVLESEPYALMPTTRLDLRNVIALDPGAILLAAELVCPAVPDKPGEWRSETVVHDLAGCPLLIDRQEMFAQTAARLARLPDHMTAFGTIWIMAQTCSDIVADLPDVPARVGVTALRAGAGFAIRLGARDGGKLRAASRRLMDALEPRLVARQAAASRAEPAMVAQT